LFNIPVVFFIYKRIETTKQVFDTICKIKPKKLYLIADGPKSEDLFEVCKEIREYIENNISWNCNLVRIYSEQNLGLAKRVSTGLSEVFAHEESAIILEDDTLPNLSFFEFCEELLLHYAENHRIGHISGCNFYPEIFNSDDSYVFSSFINVWGWATWRRSWKNFDLSMSSWRYDNKDLLLNKWCVSQRQKKGLRKMFDLHCENDDPWAWSYQWIYSCWKNNALSIIPRENLVSNLGIGPDATNTTSSVTLQKFPKTTQSMTFPLLHPEIDRDQNFDKRYLKASKTPFTRTLKNIVKSWL
jgi:hypothetical protein